MLFRSKHFHDKVAHLPQTRPFKCPDCSHVNEFQGGLVKHFGVYHGVFNGILKDMGLLDVREDIKRSTIKFPRPKVERLVAPGPNDNIALELARTAAIWSGNAREEEEVLKEVNDQIEIMEGTIMDLQKEKTRFEEELENFDAMSVKILDGVVSKQPALEVFDAKITQLYAEKERILAIKATDDIGWLKVNS